MYNAQFPQGIMIYDISDIYNASFVNKTGIISG